MALVAAVPFDGLAPEARLAGAFVATGRAWAERPVAFVGVALVPAAAPAVRVAFAAVAFAAVAFAVGARLAGAGGDVGAFLADAFLGAAGWPGGRAAGS